VIESAFKDGPDLVFLQEVENKRVLNQLFKEHLAGLGFSVAHLIEGRDPRGIDVAILHKGKDLAEPFQRNFVITRKKGKRSNHVRPFLVTTFSWNGKKIAAISVHLPSPRHPPSFRVEGLKALTVLAKELSKENDLVIAGGDFNVSSAEDSRLYRHMAGKDWMVSHHEACKRCLGTNYYKSRDSWSFLDAILILRETGSARFKSSATRIVKDLSFQQTSAGRPARMHLRGNRLEGISDHFALASIVEISSSPETSKIN
jgi:endonuclease/exonuclease/phosphatase family metal-dependent hydrolase